MRIIIAIVQCVATAAGLIVAPLAFAGTQDSRFDIIADTVIFKIKNVSRREVLQRLFAGTRTELKWIDKAYADEQIAGTFNGSRDTVLREMLRHADFVAVYDQKQEVASVVILGPNHKDAEHISIVTAAQQRVGADAPMGAIPVGANAMPLQPVNAMPPVDGTVAPAPTPAMPVVTAVTELEPISANPVGSAGIRLAPISAIPVVSSGLMRH